MEFDIEEQSLLRQPIASYREKNKKTKNRNNPEDLKTLYPDVDHLDESEDFNMNDDTHSVQNGLEDQEVVDCPVSNSLIEGEQFMMQLDDARLNINVGQGPSQKEALAPLRAASVDKNLPCNRKNRMSGKPIQQPKRQISISPERRPGKSCNLPPNLKPGSQVRALFPGPPEHSSVQKSVHQEDLPEKGYRYFILAGIVLVAIIYVCFNPSEKEKTVTWNYHSIVSSFTHSFKGQPEYSFRVFKSALKAINQTEPSAPAVILFLASKGAENLARNLGEKLVNSVSTSPVKIYGKDYQKLDSDSGKKRIDDALRLVKADSDSEYGAVLVEDLHLIPGETALMFHTYCDNENAPFKHAVYVLIVHMEEAISVNSKTKDWDIAVYKRLNRAWSDIEEDQRNPLLSRLTVSVAAILENDIAG